MFSLAILIGTYSYLIFVLGILGLMSKAYIWSLTFIFLIGITYWKRKKILESVKDLKKISFRGKNITIYLVIFLLLIIINILGVLSPEISFDALWYHLTLPKIYLLNFSVVHIPGSLLYYSDMPKLIEMVYASALTLGGQTMAKFTHFLFGIATSYAIYRLMSKYYDRRISIIASLIFYSSLVVLWESTSAYIDLARSFFELMALWGIINWWNKCEKKWLAVSSVMMGLAISVKVLSFGSVFIFIALIIYRLFKKKSSALYITANIFFYIFISLLIPLPWFVFSYLNTGSPIYPFFTGLYPLKINPNLVGISTELWNLFTRSSDPISPLCIIFIPALIILFNRLKKEIKIISFYSLLALIVWYLTPRTGGGRFVLPYLPAFSIVTAGTISVLEKEGMLVKRLIFCLLIFVFLTSVIYRSVASFKYIPVVFGKETKAQFLSKNLNFSFGDFYDLDNYFMNKIKKSDKVLLYGFHNLYYVDFPFIDSSWVKKGDKFNYIAVQNAQIPERFSYWKTIYENKTTRVKLYSAGGQMWVY